MPVVDVSNIYEIIVQGRTDGQASLNVLHYRTSDPTFTPPSYATMEDLLAKFIPLWRTAVLANQGASLDIVQYIMYEYVETQPGGYGEGEISHLIVGNQLVEAGVTGDEGKLTGEMLPAYSAVGYRKITAKRSRNYRGSLRISDIPEVMTQLNALTPTGLTQYDPAKLDPLLRIALGPAGGFDMDLCVFSKRLSRKGPFTQDLRQYSNQVINWGLSPLITSQVSRKRRYSLGS